MAVVALRSLRVTADFDSANYARGMAAKVAADAAGAASSKAVGIALAQTDAAMDKATGRVSALSRSLIDGYGTTAKFESTIRSIGRAVDQGMGLDRAAVLIEAANRKFGLTANTAALARQGYQSIVPVVAEVNARYIEQAAAADKAAASLRRLADARDASARMVGGMSAVGAPRYTDLAASERLIAGMSGAMDHFGNSTRQASYLTKQLSFQLYDVAQGIPLVFASPLYGLQNLAVQTGQITQLYAGQGGLKQAFADTKGMAVSLGATLISGLSSPLGQVAIIAGVAATAVGALFLHEHSQAQEAEAALKRHIELIGRIKDAWSDAKGSVEAYGTESLKLLLSIEQEQQKTIREQLNRDAMSPTGGAYQYGSTIASLGVPPQVAAAARELRKEAGLGAADWRKYGEAISAALNDPSLKTNQRDILRGLLDEAAAHARIQAELLKTKKALTELTEADDQRQSFRKERTQGAGDVGRASDTYRTSVEAATASYQAQLLSIRAISHEEQIAAARTQARANALQDGKITAQELVAIERAGNLVQAQFDAQRQHLQNDTMFGRSQMGRTGTERSVADAMRQLWAEDYPKFMGSAEAAQIRFNEELAKSVTRMDEIRGTTKDTISTLLGGLESGKLGDSVASAMENIKSHLNDAISGTITKGLLGESGQFGGGPVANFLSKFIPGLGGSGTPGATPANPLYVISVGGAGGVGGILGGIFDGRTAGGGGGRSSILDIIARAEGTGGNYNETLARGLLTGGKRNLTGMSLDQIDALQSSMLQNPANRWNSSALGRYQITQRTLRDLRGEMGLSGSEMYDPQMQDMLAGRLLNRRGPNIGGLRSEWAGLSEGDASQIATMMKASGEKITGSLDQLGTGMQQSVSSFSPQFGGSLQKLLSLFASSGLSSAAFSLGAGGGAGLFAAGGYIRGAGSGTSDSILARISNGEFVVNAAATSRHRSMLETINSAPRFSAGGMVGGGGYGSKTEVHVHNNNGSKVNVKHSQDGRGQPRVEISVDEQVAGALRSDRSARTMATQYGAGRRLERT